MEQDTNWGQSVTAVVIRERKVLLARHTYGNGKGLLIIPGGYVNVGETPQQALKREYMEETNICIEPEEIIGIRFNMHDWYIAFRARYISGMEKSDGDENSEVVWVDLEEALRREDVAGLTKTLIEAALKNDRGMQLTPYHTSNSKYAPQSLYCL